MKLFNKVAAIAVGVMLATGVGAGIVLGSSNAIKAEAASYNATMAAGTNSSSATINTKTAVKCGTSKNAGVMTMTLSNAGASSVSFYCAGWNGDSVTVNVTATSGVTLSTSSFSPTSDSGISGTGSAFTLNGTEATYLRTIDLTHAVANTVITLTAKNASKCRFVVWGATYDISGGSSVDVTGVSVSPTSASIVVGQNTTLTETVSPNNATNKGVTWSTSNADVATVSDGVVTGVDAGSATITVTTSDGGFTASSTITVGLPTISDDTNVAGALAVINALSDGATTSTYYKVTGYVVSAESYNTSFNNITFTIADAKGGTPVLTCFRVKCSAAIAETILPNAKVTLTGKLEKYVSNSTTTPELVSSLQSQLLVLEAGEVESVVDDGDSFVIYYGTAGNEIYFSGVENDIGTYTSVESEAAVITAIESATSGQFALSFDGVYLSYSGSSNKIYTSTENNSNATLWTITNGGTYDTIQSVNVTGRHFRYNTNSGQERFCCYTSESNVHVKKLVVANPTTLALNTKTMNLAMNEESDALTFTTDSPSAVFHWYSEDTNKATVANGVVTAVANSGTVKIYVYFDTNGNGQFDLGTDLSDYCTVTLTLPVIDYSSVTYGGVGTLVSSLADLSAGDTIAITNENDDALAGTTIVSNTIRLSTASFSITNNKLVIGDGTEEIDALILKVDTYNSSTGEMTLKSGDKWLSSTGAKKANLADAAFTWTLSFESSTTVLTSSNENGGTMQYNYNSGTDPRFIPYASTQTPIHIWNVVEYEDEAETYAANFMNSGLCGTNDNTKADSSIWMAQRTAFLALSTGAQNVLKNATENASSPDAIQECLARYDRVIYLHYGSEPEAYPDFMSRVANHYVTPMSNSRGISGSENASTAAAMVVVVVSAVSVTAIGGFFLLKKKPF